LNVEFDVLKTEFDGGFQRLEGVFRKLGGIAAVGDDLRQGVQGHDSAV
jgi:hypothetical protein